LAALSAPAGAWPVGLLGFKRNPGGQMNRSLFATVVALLPLAAHAAESDRRYFPATPGGAGGPTPPYSGAVLAGRTLYVAGTTDRGPVAGETAAAAARRVLDNVKREVESGGLTMDDLVWVQIFSSDLADYAAFNEVYRSYFKGPMPARAYLGVDHLLGGAKFEVMGIAVKR
jgi:2-iminobutanoate/2-iminopropanoate deaminase